MKAPVLIASIATAMIAGCDLAPVYDPPRMSLAESYQGSGPFRTARLDEALSPRGQWWTVFGDAELNQLEEQLGRENWTLQEAVEAYTQARSLAAEAQSRGYPQIDSSASTSENRQSEQRLFRVNPRTTNQQSSNALGLAAAWEPDFWHAIRNSAHAQSRLAQASAADLANARLSLQAELAGDYIALRGMDAGLEVLRKSIISYHAAVQVTQLRATGKIASGLDLARASSQLGSAQAQETDLRLQRDLLQHAIAVLVGAMPSRFSINAVTEMRLRIPEVPPGVPSELLERRPDIASAERQMAAANVEIGVSRAAFYPNITLNATAGFQARALDLASLPESLWSIGAAAALPVFEGGLRHAELRRSWSAYAQTRDRYRATVLSAFQEVEDGLSLTQRLSTEVQQQQTASDQAAQALNISTTLYKAGLDNYLSVTVAQTQALATETSEVQARVRELQGCLSLIRALGGGWTVHELPTEKRTLKFGSAPYDESAKR
jgi:NodT family efflux transporter outer membrane factor (OMF) lipoprotein